MKDTFETVFKNDIRLDLCGEIRPIFEGKLNHRGAALFFISPDFLVKSKVVKELLHDHIDGLQPIFYEKLRLFSLEFEPDEILRVIANSSIEKSIIYIYAYYAKTQSIPSWLIQKISSTFDKPDAGPGVRLGVNLLLYQYYFINNSTDMAEKHIKYALDFISKGYGAGLYEKMIVYYSCAKYLEKTKDIFAGGAESYYVQALECAEELCDGISMASILNDLSYYYHNMELLDKAIECASRALELSGIIKLDEIAFTTNKYLGIIYLTKGDFDSSAAYTNKAIEISEKLEHFSWIATIKLLNFLGYNYYMTGDFEKSLEYYLKALTQLSFLTSIPELLDEAIKTFDNLSSCLRMLGDIEKSIYFSNMALRLMTNSISRNMVNEIHNLCKQYTDTGLLYAIYLKDCDRAADCYNHAVHNIDENDHYIKQEKLHMLESCIKAISGDLANSKRLFDNAYKSLKEKGSTNIYVQHLLIEYCIFFSSIFIKDKEKLLSEAGGVADKFNLNKHFSAFYGLLSKPDAFKAIDLNYKNYPINLIMMVSEERKQVLQEWKKAKDFELLQEFSERVQSAASEDDLYKEAEYLFNKYFLSKGFASVIQEENNVINASLIIHDDVNPEANRIRADMMDFIRENNLFLNHGSDEYKIFAKGDLNFPQCLKSMIVYRIFDEISNNSYLFIIFNESSCSWFFTDEDAQAGLILINNLFLKLKHIQYINSIKQKTITDSLTGLYNSDYMWTSLEGLIEKYEDSNDCFSMVFIDLDKFKDINDTFGHPVGDEVLRFFAGILKKALHPYDMIIRYGGDEFAVILPRLGCEEASRVMNEFQEVCSKELFRVGGNNIKIGFSYGIENYSKNFGSSSDFFTRIDNLMYYSKEKKRSVK